MALKAPARPAASQQNGAETAAAVDFVAAAREADLIYVSDALPGMSRRKAGDGFRYFDTEGRLVHDSETLARIKKLAIPPAWSNVWVCPSPDGHLQATGRDSRGRKQYRYHPRWRQVRDRTKYERTIAFGDALPLIRSRVDHDLARPGLPRDKVLATVVSLLERTLARVGNKEYADRNGSFGLTTLRDRHVDVSGSTIRFEFRGKSNKRHSLKVRDRRLAGIVRRCQEIKGYELFQYVDDDGRRCVVRSEDVNAYLREITGQDFSAKDFRTWAGTVLAALALRELETFSTQGEAKRNLTQAIEDVARSLGNTPAICRKCYVHPDVIDHYMEGTLADALRQRAEEQLADPAGLTSEEAAVLALLRDRLRGKTDEARLSVSVRNGARPSGHSS